MPHDEGRRTHLTYHSGHPGLTENGQRHSYRAPWSDVKSHRGESLNELRQAAAPLGLVAVTGVVGRYATFALGV